MPSMKSVDPVKHSASARFKFRCHKGIECFTKCCSNIEIMLTPYDIVRLKNRLGISSGEFLNDYTYVKLDEKSSHPMVYLKMNEGSEGLCPFVSDGGCSVYADRPANCRYYPVGQASLRKMDEASNMPVTEEFYFFVREDHCKGYQEETEWTIASWRDDQGVDVYDTMNRGWKDILFRKDAPGTQLDEKIQKAFYMACYDVDRFRDFVFGSRFMDIFDIPKKRIEKMRSDEIELMKFGFDYTKYILGLEETLKTKK